MNNKFDKGVKRAFEDLEDGINPESIWDGINTKMKASKNNRKRRFIIWWVFGLGISLLLIALIYNQDVISIARENKLPVSSSERVSENAVTKDITYESSESKNVVSADINSIDNTQNENVSNEPLKNSSGYSEILQSDILQSDNDRDLTKEIQPIVNPSHGGITNFNVDLRAISDAQKNSSIKQAESDDRVRSEISGIALLKMKEINLLESNESKFKWFDKKASGFKILDDSKKIRPFNSVEVYGGISIGNKSIFSLDDDYNALRNDSEKLLEQLNIGTRIQLIQFLDFRFLAGVRYSKVTDLWKMSLDYVEDRSFTYSDYRVEYLDGTTEEHFTTETLEHGISRYVEQYNSEQIIAIPLELRFGKKLNNWTIAVGTGIDLHYLFGAKYKVLGPEYIPVEESKDGQWLNPTISLGLFISYEISPQWDLSANFNYRNLSIQNSSLSIAPKAKYRLYGLELGLVRRLDW